MARRRPKDVAIQPDPLHTAEKLTEGDRKDLWIACLEAQTAKDAAERARLRALEFMAAYDAKGRELLAKYKATALRADTGELTRETAK